MAAKRLKPVRVSQPSVPRLALAGVAFKGLVALALVGGVVYAVAWLGGLAGTRIADRDRYAVRFADIVCDAPPGKDRSAFLTEVRYLSSLPETIPAVGPDLSEQLTAAFARHPWVAEAIGVKVEADATVHVELRFRVPVLLVHVRGEAEARVVDRTGVLLPDGAPIPRTELLTPIAQPPRQAGAIWTDPTVERAAELSAEYAPKWVEKTEKGWRLTLENGKVLLVSW